MTAFLLQPQLQTAHGMLSFLKSRDSGEKPGGWLTRLKQGLAKPRQQFGQRLSGLFGSGRKLDEEFYEELETVLLISDVGVAATGHLIAQLRARARRERYTEAAQLREALSAALLELLQPVAVPLDISTHKPFVIMLAGVNGAGKPPPSASSP